MNIVGVLFKFARFMATVKAFSKGSKSASRRVKNKAVGRGLGRAGVWSRIWR